MILAQSTNPSVAMPTPIVPHKSHVWAGFKGHQARAFACATTVTTLTTQANYADVS